MKKLYVKPTATNVAYAVNENIALSVGNMDTIVGDPSDITYINVDRSLCNKEVANTGIASGLIPGCTNIHHVLAKLQAAAKPFEGTPEYENTDFMKLWNIVDSIRENKTPEDFACI